MVSSAFHSTKAVVKERVELLIEHFGRCERTNVGINAPPTGTLFHASFCALCGFSALRQCSIGLGRIIYYPALNHYYIALMH